MLGTKTRAGQNHERTPIMPFCVRSGISCPKAPHSRLIPKVSIRNRAGPDPQLSFLLTNARLP